MEDLVSMSLADFAAKLKLRYPQFQSASDTQLVNAFIQKNSQYRIVNEGTNTVKVCWERPVAKPTASAQQPDSSCSAVSEPISKPVGEEGLLATDPAAESSTIQVGVGVSNAPQEVSTATGLGPMESTGRGRPILGVSLNPSQPIEPEIQRSLDATHAFSALPLATELPSWDLLPADNLLVRRRSVKR